MGTSSRSCPTCGLNFPEPELKRHQRTKSHEFCASCELAFTDSIEHEKHNKECHSFSCPSCNEKPFFNRFELEEHQIRFIHCACVYCSLIFDNQQTFIDHQEEHHYRLSCVHCGLVFHTDGKLHRHKQDHHSHLCSICSQILPSLRTLRNHQQATEHLYCRSCDIFFASRGVHGSHSAALHAYKCHACGQGFESPQVLGSHLDAVHPSYTRAYVPEPSGERESAIDESDRCELRTPATSEGRISEKETVGPSESVGDEKRSGEVFTSQYASTKFQHQCFPCRRDFKTGAALSQHCRDKGHLPDDAVTENQKSSQQVFCGACKLDWIHCKCKMFPVNDMDSEWIVEKKDTLPLSSMPSHTPEPSNNGSFYNRPPSSIATHEGEYHCQPCNRKFKTNFALAHHCRDKPHDVLPFGQPHLVVQPPGLMNIKQNSIFNHFNILRQPTTHDTVNFKTDVQAQGNEEKARKKTDLKYKSRKYNDEQFFPSQGLDVFEVTKMHVMESENKYFHKAPGDRKANNHQKKPEAVLSVKFGILESNQQLESCEIVEKDTGLRDKAPVESNIQLHSPQSITTTLATTRRTLVIAPKARLVQKALVTPAPPRTPTLAELPHKLLEERGQQITPELISSQSSTRLRIEEESNSRDGWQVARRKKNCSKDNPNPMNGGRKLITTWMPTIHSAGPLFKPPVWASLNHWQSFRCQLCSREFGSPNKLTRHYNGAHQCAPQQRRFQCKVCGHRYRNAESLSRHLNRDHKLPPHAAMQLRKQQEIKRRAKKNRATLNQFDELGLCHDGPNARSRLRSHAVQLRKKGERIDCLYCDKVFSRDIALKAHCLRKHPLTRKKKLQHTRKKQC